jgi:hypothetical protein
MEALHPDGPGPTEAEGFMPANATEGFDDERLRRRAAQEAAWGATHINARQHLSQREAIEVHSMRLYGAIKTFRTAQVLLRGLEQDGCKLQPLNAELLGLLVEAMSGGGGGQARIVDLLYEERVRQQQQQQRGGNAAAAGDFGGGGGGSGSHLPFKPHPRFRLVARKRPRLPFEVQDGTLDAVSTAGIYLLSRRLSFSLRSPETNTTIYCCRFPGTTPEHCLPRGAPSA